MGERARRSKGAKGSKAYCILGSGSPSPMWGQGVRGERERRGVKGSKAYCMLGFRVPTTSAGARGEGEQRGQSILHTRL